MTKQLEKSAQLRVLQGVWFKRGLVGLSVMLVTLGGIGATYLAIIIARDRRKLPLLRHW
jgi:hypothetical protein